MELEEIGALKRSQGGKTVLLVMDGLGGLPDRPGGATELETARTPNLDRLAAEGICGLHQPVAAGVTPGSGPAHLGLFGYDPLLHKVGRGVLSALGIGFDLRPGDIAARGNFCTVVDGVVTDRRAGRLPSARNQELCERLRSITLGDGVELFVQTVRDYRFLLVLRGEGLSERLADTDPQSTGTEPLPPRALKPEAERTAVAVRRFVDRARGLLAGDDRANMVLLRGFSSRPSWPSLPEVYGARAAAVAVYPMYRGVARLVGMEVLETGDSLADEIATVARHWDDFDFFFLHFKPTDSAGEDGDFARKVGLIESVDAELPRLLELGPDVLVVTGDHSTPAVLKGHSWHPVPVLLWAATCRPDGVQHFGERDCAAGALGPNIPAIELLPIAFAHAQRFDKYGA